MFVESIRHGYAAAVRFTPEDANVRFGVISAVVTAGRSLPVYPDQQTFSGSVSTSPHQCSPLQ
jgi:hypothetical protein